MSVIVLRPSKQKIGPNIMSAPTPAVRSVPIKFCVNRQLGYSRLSLTWNV